MLLVLLAYYYISRDNARKRILEMQQPPWKEDGEWLSNTYGEIVYARFVRYWKYVFVIEVETTSGLCLQLTTGGDPDLIYKYNPMRLDWTEHLDVGLLRADEIVRSS